MGKEKTRDGKLITCVRCGYSWITTTRRNFITCPNCIRKTVVSPVEYKKISEVDIDGKERQ